jgi:ubiquinone/menaquinone biosynthesis C-methylase UbiE
MDQQRQKALLKETFDTVAAGYDGSALRFFPASAARMAELLELRGDERVLDVACGTGNASLALARSVPRGHVTAVDFSPGMLRRARDKAGALNIGNVEFLERDMQDLGFPHGSFDAAASAFGIFFVEDMAAQLAHIAATVKPGGTVIISNFQEGYFHPLKELLVGRLAGYGVPPPQQTWKRIASEAGCRKLFAEAGLTGIRVSAENLGYFLESAEQWWEVVWNAGFRRLLSRIAPQDQSRFKREHLEEVAAAMTPKGLWLDVGVLFTSGTKA